MSEYSKWRGDRLEIRYSPGWSKKYPLGPVHFDVRCSIHGKEFLDIPPERLPSSEYEFMNLLDCCYGKSSS